MATSRHCKSQILVVLILWSYVLSILFFFSVLSVSSVVSLLNPAAGWNKTFLCLGG